MHMALSDDRVKSQLQVLRYSWHCHRARYYPGIRSDSGLRAQLQLAAARARAQRYVRAGVRTDPTNLKWIHTTHEPVPYGNKAYNIEDSELPDSNFEPLRV